MKTLAIACASAFAIFCAVAGTASAASAQRVVSYADLDLSKPQGSAIMLTRLELASHQVCGTEPDIRDLDSHGQYMVCVKSTLDSAVHAVPSSMLMSIYNGAPETLASR